MSKKLIPPGLEKKIFEYNKKKKENEKKAADLNVIVKSLMALPPGQLKKMLTDEAIEVMKGYGYVEGE